MPNKSRFLYRIAPTSIVFACHTTVVSICSDQLLITLHLFIFCVCISELTDFKTRRIAHFRKNMVDLVELEIKHAKVSLHLYLIRVCRKPLWVDVARVICFQLY